MLSVFNYLKRPEYVLHPRQVFRRFRRFSKEPERIETVTLPWRAQVRVHPHENVGSSIYYYGIFDRIVPEAIHRLTDPGELAVEIGANIGQNCSLMALKVGSSGRVIAFEPHPEIFQELQNNAALWPAPVKRVIELEKIALGENSGEAFLADGSEFSYNRGSAALCESEKGSGRRFKVALRRLDEYLPPQINVGVCKIDVEGHELSVLKGAVGTLARRGIRDIIFEDFNPMFSPPAQFLQQHGFMIFEMTGGWWKPVLTPVRPGLQPPQGFSFNYLATLDPERARQRFKKGGWRCLMYW
jgi:FkbM family methyltransferase